jgi:hypothetical protein
MYKSSQEIRKWIYSCKNRFTLYNKLNPIFTDISWKHNVDSKHSIQKKWLSVQDILVNECPANIEVGKISSEYALETIQYYKSIEYQYCFYNEGPLGFKIRNRRYFYIGIPSYLAFEFALKNQISSLSFETSVSEPFLLKNTGRSIKETKTEFNKMHEYIKRTGSNIQKKLSISCITDCPYNGKTDPLYVVREILDYNRFEFTEICLCDNMGNIEWDDFEYIVQYCIFFGIPPSKISLQLHVSPKNTEKVQKMIRYALSMGINKFDVSNRCEISLKPGSLEYLSYDLFYHTLSDYIEKKGIHKKLNRIV